MIEFALRTDCGKVRLQNQDSCAVDENAGLFVVCDGMGGAAGGEVASTLALRAFMETAHHAVETRKIEDRLREATEAANHAVYDEAQNDPSLRGMGTTLVALQTDEDSGDIWLAHVGDSRCYRFRNGKLEVMTQDHSYVAEQVAKGVLTNDQAERSPYRNVITRAIGSQDAVEVDVQCHEGQQDDIYLLCSDGLNGELSDDEILGILLDHVDQNLEYCALEMVKAANAAGGNDNITVVLVRLT